MRTIKEAGLIPERDIRLCAVGDGARWIGKAIKEIFPDALHVLDYYHAREYLYDAAEGIYDKSDEVQEWAEAMVTRLFVGEIGEVIHELKHSPNKTVCHLRLKRSGAWWYKEKANLMLALRCAKYNGTFQRLFRRYMERQKKDNLQRGLWYQGGYATALKTASAGMLLSKRRGRFELSIDVEGNAAMVGATEQPVERPKEKEERKRGIANGA